MFTGNEPHDIPLAEAAKWTKNYRDTITPGQTIGHYFGKQALQDIMNQDGCVGLRFYYAIDDEGIKQLVIVGVNAAGNDLYQGLIGDRSYRTPPHSGANNPLNS